MIDDSEEQIQLISYNPPETTSGPRYELQHRNESDDYEYIDPHYYSNSPKYRNHQVSNFITIPQKQYENSPKHESKKAKLREFLTSTS